MFEMWITSLFNCDGVKTINDYNSLTRGLLFIDKNGLPTKLHHIWPATIWHVHY